MANKPVTVRGHQTRQRILVAARTVFAREGYLATRMIDVVTAAGISTGAVYRYFRDKEDLFTAVVGDLHEELYRVSRSERFSFATDPYDALYEANLNYLRVFHQNRHVLRAFREAVAVNERFALVAESMRRRHNVRFVRACRRLHSITDVDGVDLSIAAEALACMVEQASYVWFAEEEKRENAVSVEDAARVVARAWYRMVFDQPEGGSATL